MGRKPVVSSSYRLHSCWTRSQCLQHGRLLKANDTPCLLDKKSATVSRGQPSVTIVDQNSASPLLILVIVQWIEQVPPKNQIQVRFLLTGPHWAFGEMDIISVFETEGGSSILSRPAKTVDMQTTRLYNYCVAVSKQAKLPLCSQHRSGDGSGYNPGFHGGSKPPSYIVYRSIGRPVKATDC